MAPPLATALNREEERSLSPFGEINCKYLSPLDTGADPEIFQRGVVENILKEKYLLIHVSTVNT